MLLSRPLLLLNRHQSLRYIHLVMATCYELLGVDADADPGVIRSAYLERIQKCHPDLTHDQGTGAQFRSLHEAFETLVDPGKRAEYDRGLAGATSGSGSPPATYPGWDPSPPSGAW